MSKLNHHGSVQLETPRLILRPFQIEDAAAMHANWAGDSAVTRYLRWPAHESVRTSQNVIATWLAQYEKKDFYQWAIELKSLGEPIGSISGFDVHETLRSVAVGYCLGRKWWGQGLTTEALRRLLPFFFETVGMNRVEAMHDPRNAASGRVMQKCGLRQEGLRRQGDYNHQGLVDGVCHAILAEDHKRQG